MAKKKDDKGKRKASKGGSAKKGAKKGAQKRTKQAGGKKAGSKKAGGKKAGSKKKSAGRAVQGRLGLRPRQVLKGSYDLIQSSTVTGVLFVEEMIAEDASGATRTVGTIENWGLYPDFVKPGSSSSVSIEFKQRASAFRDLADFLSTVAANNGDYIEAFCADRGQP